MAQEARDEMLKAIPTPVLNGRGNVIFSSKYRYCLHKSPYRMAFAIICDVVVGSFWYVLTILMNKETKPLRALNRRMPRSHAHIGL